MLMVIMFTWGLILFLLLCFIFSLWDVFSDVSLSHLLPTWLVRICLLSLFSPFSASFWTCLYVPLLSYSLSPILVDHLGTAHLLSSVREFRMWWYLSCCIRTKAIWVFFRSLNLSVFLFMNNKNVIKDVASNFELVYIILMNLILNKLKLNGQWAWQLTFLIRIIVTVCYLRYCRIYFGNCLF